MFQVYAGKKILITGHTGFKGAWLSTWLAKLGANVVGFSNDIPTQPSMFEAAGLAHIVSHNVGDVRDLAALKAIINRERPDFVLHLAAQAIVSLSYQNPTDTITTNVVGTMNVMEALRTVDHPCVALIITSDKCYENVEWVWGYRENDRLGGRDIYSGSKGAAEVVIQSYLTSFFGGKDCPVRIGIGRAGNVIGGGDWARDRIVADCMRAWAKGDAVEIRSPKATRPWQHVLEPLSGYLALGAALAGRPELHGEAFNFGPRAEQNHTVLQLLTDLAASFEVGGKGDHVKVTGNIPFHEAGLLKLNCDKALFHLKWEATLDYSDTIRFVSDWYRDYYKNSADMYEASVAQIEEYEMLARQRGRAWTGAATAPAERTSGNRQA
jgi:CDP-glucose 4,6-dehydratase